MMMFLLSQGFVSAAETGETFKKPSIEDVLPPDIWFQGTIFAINRIEIVRFIALAFLLTIFCLAAKRAKIVPSRFQSIIEFVIFFVKDEIVSPIMNPSNAKKYLPIAVTLFSSIAIFNLCGIIPGLNLSGTAAIGLPLAFAIWVVYTYWRAGIRQHGFWGFLRHELMPPEIPAAIYPLIAPIELMQLLITRPFSLTVRLLCNMISGHMLIAVCYGATQFLIFNADWAMKPFGLLTFLGVGIFTAFEAFVGLLQAYIFTLLSISYIQQSLPEVDDIEAEASFHDAITGSDTELSPMPIQSTSTTSPSTDSPKLNQIGGGNAIITPTPV
ncbi:MAG: F0F1 ATP synthase subunit A [Bifidobacteriaceae bacterium]|jgi:F-type H+-transporting ATPase subunit a|nr:F0F1 ATP synthase subunit A [Bifidobacteriaceae bacterium]